MQALKKSRCLGGVEGWGQLNISFIHSFNFFYSEKQSTAVLSVDGFELPESTNATQASRVAAILNVYHCSKHLKSFEDIYLAKDGHKISAYDG